MLTEITRNGYQFEEIFYVSYKVNDIIVLPMCELTLNHRNKHKRNINVASAAIPYIIIVALPHRPVRLGGLC